MIAAKVVLRSVSPAQKYVTTYQTRYPRIIHSELMTHRVFSRNASSSRAVPTSKLIEEARSDELRARPVEWGRNQKGMQSSELLDEPAAKLVEEAWRDAALYAADRADYLMRLGAHKQIANRILEPFTHINTVITSTEWDNFFGLRLHTDADPTMQALANCMWYSLDHCVTQELKPGQWHLPFVDQEDDEPLYCEADGNQDQLLKYQIQVSTARCARVSYLSFETGKRSAYKEDLSLYKKLLAAQPIHPSPAEHPCTPDRMTDDERPSLTRDWPGGWEHPEEHGNFVGWRQHRKMLPGEAVAPLPEKYQPF